MASFSIQETVEKLLFKTFEQVMLNFANQVNKAIFI